MNMTTSDSALAAVPRFVKTLYDMLQNEDQRILSWSVDGSHFQVYDVPRLETEVLRKYFKHGKFSSFQRQLNNFGFHKWTKTRASVATFSHDVLVRCHPSELAGLASQMKMKATAATRLAAATSAKRPHGLLATPVEQSPAVKRQKMSPRDISAIDDLAGMSFASTAEPLWSLDGGCCNDELLLSTLDSVELANLAELDWEAALLPLERDERRGDGDIDIDSDIGLLDEDDVSAILSDLDTVQQLSSCELDALLGAGSDSNSDSDSDSDIAYTVDVESLLFT